MQSQLNPTLLIYNILLALLFPLSLPVIFFYGLQKKKNILEGLSQRLRPFSKVKPPIGSGKKRFWIHAASVGEVKVARTLAAGLHSRFPHSEIFLSTFTITGLREAEKISGVSEVSLLPLDFSLFIRPALKRIRPDFFFPIESEFWPNLFFELKKAGTPVILMNGRVSERSFKRYLKFRFLLKNVLLQLDLACMRTRADADRIIALGVPQDRVRVVGNMKYDGVLSEWKKEDPGPLREIFKPRTGEKIVVFGNTREGEEALLVPAIKKFLEAGTASVIIAPRHVERTREIARLLGQAGISTALWSELAAGKERKTEDVALLDQMGRLFPLYGICAAAFIGGSLLPFGGQNVLEPAAFGIPVLFGRHMGNFQEEAMILKESGGGIEVGSHEEIHFSIMKLLENPEKAAKAGRAAADAVARQGGALEKCLDELSALWVDKKNQGSGARSQESEYEKNSLLAP
ncbi:MAG: hypothetical protein HZA01_05740 [Nitrospinae bacterium]|nr:hypothetical protein [Nitrospinota bacterium]